MVQLDIFIDLHHVYGIITIDNLIDNEYHSYLDLLLVNNYST